MGDAKDSRVVFIPEEAGVGGHAVERILRERLLMRMKTAAVAALEEGGACASEAEHSDAGKEEEREKREKREKEERERVKESGG